MNHSKDAETLVHCTDEKLSELHSYWKTVVENRDKFSRATRWGATLHLSAIEYQQMHRELKDRLTVNQTPTRLHHIETNRRNT